MKILIASSEVVPFAKTGGLADVAGALPKALANLGHDVRVVMPKYRVVRDDTFHLVPVMREIKVYFTDQPQTGVVKRTTFPNTNVPVYFIENDRFFDRDELYTKGGVDYPDNAARFAFFSMAVLWMLRGLDWSPDIIQCNDWQTGLIPLYLRTNKIMNSDPFYKHIKTLFTIHNIAYQGITPPSVLPSIGIGREIFTMQGVEFYGKVNLLKAGIVFSDIVSTVSKQYSREIQTEEYGYGLEGVLTQRAASTIGILNGADYSIWNPTVDSLIPARYDESDLSGKAACKKALQKEQNVPVRANVPIIGMISRLADQKGFDLLAEAIDELMEMDLQLVILGTGDPPYHELLSDIAKKYPDKTGVNLRFDNRLAHLIEAGADMFLMPSRYEPSGLNQLYSLKYGTVPIVRKTGGLADSICNVTPATVRNGRGTGFVFTNYSASELLSTIERALKVYREQPEQWRRVMLNGMAKDFSWDNSAREYIKVFHKMIKGQPLYPAPKRAARSDLPAQAGRV